jgi:hypothetical protein
MPKIKSMTSHLTGDRVSFTTEDGESIEALIVASDGGYTIANYDAGGCWTAIQIIDYGDGEAEFIEHENGDTLDDGEDMDAYIVRRTDNAGSLKWVENVS